VDDILKTAPDSLMLILSETSEPMKQEMMIRLPTNQRKRQKNSLLRK
jgi:hypothetical protein